MNDLEERLQAELVDATDAIDPEFDVDGLIASGRRARTNRATRGVVVTVAVALAVGALAWAGAGSSLNRGNAPVVATPSVVGADVDPMSVTFNAIADRTNETTDPDVDILMISAHPSGSQIELDVTAITTAATVQKRTFTVPAGQLWHVAWNDHLAIGLLPDRVSWFSSPNNTDGGVQGDSKIVDGIGETAFWQLYQNAGGPDTINNIVWQKAGGTVRTSQGVSLPSGVVVLAGTTFSVYRDDARQEVGVHGGDGGTTQYPLQSDGVLTQGSAYGLILNQSVTCAVLPAGSTDIAVKLNGKGTWASTKLTDGSILLMAAVKDDGIYIFRSLSFTDAAGKRITVHDHP